MFASWKRYLSAMLIVFSLQACSPEPVLPHVSLEQARTEHASGKVLMIDIREPQEHATGVAQGVVLLPMSQVA